MTLADEVLESAKKTSLDEVLNDCVLYNAADFSCDTGCAKEKIAKDGECLFLKKQPDCHCYRNV